MMVMDFYARVHAEQLQRELREHLPEEVVRVALDLAGSAARVATLQTYGGERVYLPKLPKLQSAARVAKAAREGARTCAEIAGATGLSIRTVKMLRRR